MVFSSIAPRAMRMLAAHRILRHHCTLPPCKTHTLLSTRNLKAWHMMPPVACPAAPQETAQERARRASQPGAKCSTTSRHFPGVSLTLRIDLLVLHQLPPLTTLCIFNLIEARFRSSRSRGLTTATGSSRAMRRHLEDYCHAAHTFVRLPGKQGDPGLKLQDMSTQPMCLATLQLTPPCLVGRVAWRAGRDDVRLPHGICIYVRWQGKVKSLIAAAACNVQQTGRPPWVRSASGAGAKVKYPHESPFRPTNPMKRDAVGCLMGGIPESLGSSSQPRPLLCGGSTRLAAKLILG